MVPVDNEWGIPRGLKNFSRLTILSFLLTLFPIFTGLNSLYAADFVIAIDDNSSLYYASSTGDGTFSGYEFIDYLGGTNSRGVTIADFDNDGDLDFVAGRGISSTAYFYLFLNNGSNVFIKTSMVGTLSNANSWAMDMASGDFDNDGNMDFIANGNQTTTGVYLGDGTGAFTKTELSLGAYGRGMDVADFNNDGNIDFARATHSNGYVYIYPGNGDGTFGTGIYVGDAGDDPYGLAAGDFNKDGYADLIVNSGGGGDPYFFAGNGNNTFVAGVYQSSLDFGRHGAYDGFDFNGDGNLDIVAVNNDGRQVLYYPGNGNGTFGTAVTIGTTSNNSLGVSAPPIGPPARVPAASFTPESQTIAAGGTASFDGSASSDSDGVLASWQWIFGDGATDTTVGSTNHSYASEGVYSAKLRVTDDDSKSDYDSGEVIVEGGAPSIDPTPVTFGEALADDGVWSLTLNGEDYASDTEGIAAYQWEFYDGLSEDFEDGDANGWTTFAGTWSIYDSTPIGGTYSYRQADAAPDRTWNLFEKSYSSDITIEADVKLVAGSGEEAQILFRAQNEQNNYEYILRGRGYSDVLLYRRVNGSTTSLFEYDLPSELFEAIDYGQTHHIKIVCTGSLIKFYLDGLFLFSWTDSTFASGKVGFSTYRTEAMFDNLTVTAGGEGQNIQHAFGAGTYDVGLVVADSAGQTDADIIPMTMQPGDIPVADAGGPYSVGESVASQGGWTVVLDGSASSDDVGIQKYMWDFGTDTFDGTVFNSPKWLTNGGISQNDAVSLAGVNTWDTRYMVTRAVFPKVKGQVFQAKIKASGNGQCMFGFKNENSTNFHYNQFPYEFYISNQSIYIYESSYSRGYTGYNIAHNTWYDFRIELTRADTVTEAVYSYRQSGTSTWYEVYRSTYTTADTNLRKGIVVYSSTYSIDDFRDVTAGGTADYTLFRGTGVFDVSLTVYDRANQTHTAATTVTVTDGDSPDADAGGNQSKGEADASDGIWTVNFDASGSNDDYGIYFYEWDWDYDGSFDPSGDTGATVAHSWTAPGAYTVALRVWDHALQSTVDVVTVTVADGDPPTADAGGPYTVDEFSGNAAEGGWTVALDASGSSDPETAVVRYLWDLGTDTFTGTVVNSGKWAYISAGVTQNDEIAITNGSSTWGQRYLFSKDTYSRAKGMAFEARVKHSGGNAMVGFKNTSATYHYNQMPYAIYFTGGNIYIYEDGSSRGDTGYNYSYNTWYEVRIELKETQGARYYYRSFGTSDWTLLYDSGYGTATSFKRGVDVYSGTFTIDDVKEIAAGPNPSYRFYGIGSHSFTLTVWDQAYQTDTDSTSVTAEANDAPSAVAGPDQSRDEITAFENTWTLAFDGSSSSDDHGTIYRHEWDFNYDGSFEPSGETGPAVTHTFTGAGICTVALRVTDHALQSVIDTLTVTLTNGDPPVAEAGPDVMTEGHWPVVFNGGNSTDDLGIYKYEWDFGDGTTGTGRTPKHSYWAAGDYTVTLTVYDNVLQSDSDTMTVHVIAAGDAPQADAGGPYNAGAGGPPAYLNAGSSTDDYGIVKYLWDVDDAVDSDGDGDFTNDMDVVGRKPFYTYNTAGTYTVTLTVVDGAGQTATDTTTVNVATNLAPNVICVPWRAGDPTIPHETYNGRSVHLKAIVRDAGALTYQWNFGDGTALYPATPAAVSNKYAIEATHTYPNSPDGTPYVATLTVWDSSGQVGSDNYYIIVQPDSLETRTNIAIDEGLWWLHKNQNKSDWKWISYSSSAYFASATSSAIQAFEINGHLQDGDNQENPYVETVTKGLDYMFTTLSSTSISAQTYGNPDTNGNGVGLGVNSDRPIYEGGMIMDAIASSGTPLAFATTGGANVKGRFYYDILTDMVDMYAWGQYDHSTVGGGWRYSWNQGPDNSACQWAAIGMLAAEDNFGINIPQWVKDRNNVWLNYSYDGTGFGYTGPGNGPALTPSGMVQLAFCDKYTTDPRWRTAEDYIANNWFWQNNNYYAAYALVKAFRLAKPCPVVNLSATGLDWYNNSSTGVRKRLIDQQVISGSSWGSWASGGYGGRGLDTAWAIVMLTPALFVQPPVADAGDDIIWAYDLELDFDASGSFHMDPSRNIVNYEWDFNGDGNYDFSSAGPNATFIYADPNPGTAGDPPQTFTVRLRVTDDNEPAQTDIDTRQVIIAEPPHAPFAMHIGPYTATAGIPFTLDGTRSYDIDLGDSITRYQWDLDNDGVWFNDVDLDTPNATHSWTFAAPGVYNIGLKVWDNGAFHPSGCTCGVDCESMESIPVYTTVTVSANLPPVANAGGTYTVNEGTPLLLNGSGSSDPNGDTLQFAWDLDNDGAYDDSTAETPSYAWSDHGAYAVGLKVTDSLLEDTDTATVNVVDVGPAAGFTWTPEPQAEGTAVSFTDTSVSAPDSIVGWLWDFGGMGTSTDRNPSFTFNDNDTYTVTLTVTDDDGSTSSVSHDVTVTDKAPVANVTGTATLNEGETGNYDASGSISAPDAIVNCEWDWNYDGTTFNPSGNVGAIQTHTWAENGTYTVAVRVTDDDGSTDIDTLSVTVNDLGPTAVLTGSTSLDEGQQGSYDASGSTAGSDPITTYEWDWNYDGSTFNPSPETGATHSHTWMDNGTYTTAVRVTDSDGSTDIETVSVTVNDLGPDAVLTGSTSLNEGQTGSFDASGSTSSPDAIAGYEWDWNYDGSFDPSGDTGVAKNHTWMDNGTYTVAVRVTDDDGSTDIATLSVTVSDIGPGAVLTGSTSLNEGQSGNYDASGSTAGPHTIVLYEWDWSYDGSFGPSGDTGVTQNHTWMDNGTYTVAVRVTDDTDGTGIATLSVTVNDRGPTASFTWNPEPRAEGDAIAFTDGSTSSPDVITGWLWNFGGQGSSAEQNASFTFNDNGTYAVTLTVTDEDGSVGSITHNVTVTDKAPTAVLTGNTSVDEGEPGNYNASGSTSSPDTIAGHEWDWNYDGTFDPSGDTGVTQSHTWADAGTYTVAVRVTDEDGSTDIATLVVTVNETSLNVSDLRARTKIGSVQLVWTHVGAPKYKIYRSTTSGGPYSLIATSMTTICSYLDRTVARTTTYYYIVRPAAADGTELGTSNEVSITTP